MLHKSGLHNQGNIRETQYNMVHMSGQHQGCTIQQDAHVRDTHTRKHYTYIFNLHFPKDISGRQQGIQTYMTDKEEIISHIATNAIIGANIIAI